MSDHLSRAILLLLTLATALLSAGCEGDSRRVERARAAYAAGQFDLAAQALDGAQGEVALALAERVEEALIRRRSALEEIETIVARAPEPAHAELERLLREGPGRIADPAVADAIASARSFLADEYAAARARGMRWEAAGGEEPANEPEAPEAPLASALFGESSGPARHSAPPPGEGEALPRAHSTQTDPVKPDTVEPAPREAGETPSEPWRAPVAIDTPNEQRSELLAQGAPHENEGAQGATPPEDELRRQLEGLTTVDALLSWSYEQESTGRMDLACAAIQRAIASEPEPARRESLSHELARVDDRRAFRQQLSKAILSERESFAEIGVIGVQESGIRFDGLKGFRSWARLGAEDWRALASKAKLSGSARLGLAMELLESSQEQEADEILSRLVRLDPAMKQRVDRVVAWHRDEDVPAGGYVYRGDAWVLASIVQQDADAEQVAQLARRFPRLKGAERDEAYDQLFALGRRDLCQDGLRERWLAAAEDYRQLSGRKSLEDLIEARHEVDRVRDILVGRIEDTYEYPAETSGDGAQTRKQESQKFIDRTTRELRDVFKKTRPFALRDATRELLEEIRWLDDREHELRMKRTGRPAELPPWLLAVDLGQKQLTLENFGWTREETRALARDRAVLRRNEALLSSKKRELEESRTSTEEARQVEVTSEYRVLLGRRALAWNPQLQAAAKDHSDYMSQTGDFGHSETTPGRETPGARMRARGYGRPGGENCFAGGASADAAHQAWLHSPGHHRNIIAAGYTEMASSQVGRYWTQVFGSDTAFVNELEEWSD